MAVPGRYRRVVIDFSKRGLDGFDFGKYNRTSLVGLENLLPNSYTNAVLQMMFYVPEVKGLVLGKQYVWGCWGNEKSVVCEMGFLFHMLEMALVEATATTKGGKKEEGKEGEPVQQRPARLPFSSIPPPAPKPCQSSNFLRVFRHVPEVVALGLLEASTAAPVQQRAEGAHRFFLSQIHGEDSAAAAPSSPPLPPASSSSHRRGGRGGAKKAAAAAAAAADKHAAAAAAAAEDDDNEDDLGNSEGGGGREGGSGGREKSVIDSLYGYTARTTNTFLHPPNLPPKVTTTRSFILELVYPRTLSRGAGGSPTSSPTLKPTPASPSFPPSSSSSTSFSLPTDASYLAKSKKEKILSVLTNINAAATATTAGPSSLPPPLPTFSQILHSSLCRETRSRGWCEASKGYEPLKQQRVVSSLPSLLVLHGGVAVGTGAEVARQIWHQLNPLGGPWLPERVRVKVGGGRKGGRSPPKPKQPPPPPSTPGSR